MSSRSPRGAALTRPPSSPADPVRRRAATGEAIGRFPRGRLLRPFAFALALLFASCEREERGFRVEPPSAGRANTVSMTDLQPGPAVPSARTENEYEGNAYALSEGQRLYEQMNCVGCHARGGGGMGPPLMDARWIYGSDPAQVFSTIVEGRPNGMPSFRGRLNDDQVWKIAAYVRSLSGQVPKDAAPARSDDMSGPPPPASASEERPKAAPGIPRPAEVPK